MAHGFTGDHVEHNSCDVDRQTDVQLGDKEPTKISQNRKNLRNDFLVFAKANFFGSIAVG